MGLDASVMCACWSRGLTTPPPVAVERIAIDSEGWLQASPADETASKANEAPRGVLGPLERIFRASVETGNPVRWC